MDRTVMRGQLLELRDGVYEVQGAFGSTVRLRGEDGYELVMDLAELPDALGEPMLLTDPRFNSALLRKLERADRQLIKSRLRAVLRVLGQADPDDPQFALYDPSATTRIERLHRQAAALKAAELPGCENTLRNWIARYEAAGDLGLRERRASRPKRHLGRTDDRVVDVVAETLAEHVEKSDTTDKHLVAEVRKTVILRHSSDSRPPVLPSDRTLRRRLNEMRKAAKVNGPARRRRSMGKVPDRMFQRRPVLFPGEEVQADTSAFDVLVRDRKGAVVRAKVTLMLDIGTRSVVGENITYGPPHGQQHAFMLVASMTTSAVAHGHVLPWTVDLSGFSWAAGLTPADVQAAVEARPFIPAHRLVIDNARDNRSRVSLRAAEQLGVDLTYANPGDPTNKPEVERTFDSMWKLLAEDMPGYISRGSEFRGDEADRDDLIDIYSLAAVLQAWIAIKWQNREHEGLRDYVHTGVKLTPNEMYRAMADRAQAIPLPLTRDEYIGFLPCKRLTCQLDGFQIDYRQYDSELLDQFRRQPCPGTADGKWVVHYNDFNPAVAWVRNPLDYGEMWIELIWKNRAFFEQPFNRAVRAAGRQAAARLGVASQPEVVVGITRVIGQTDVAHAQVARERDRAAANETLAQQMGLFVPQPRKPGSRRTPADRKPASPAPEITAFDPTEEAW